MSSDEERQHVHTLIDRLPAAELRAVEGLLSALLNRTPTGDDTLTEEEEQAILRSEEWFEKNGGKGIPMEDVLAEFGLSMKDFPLEKRGA